ncbi:MAG: Asp-tRNA(Asn)/Glu-tRNA(Gln) amidotransferase subunit GatB [Mycoplasmoidaceae bacterium]
MFNYLITIGIEVHVAITTQSKMFSSSKNARSLEPNIDINEIDLGLPGIMPAPNAEVVRKAIVLAKALNMELDKDLRFDRKNYFYQDLPKGYQITQHFFPIGKNGFLEIEVDQEIKRIEIERIHIEEDTAKQIKTDGGLFLDYNRAGIPLIEIVTKPNINSGKEAAEFLKTLRRILQFNSISDGKMEDGSLRADINISIAPIGSQALGTRIEIKNINSIANVELAIAYEANRQYQSILNNIPLEYETRRFNDKNNQTEFMRQKTTNIDYRYMVEPNIINIRFDQNFIDDAIKKYYIDLDSIKAKLLKDGATPSMIEHLLNEYSLFKTFNDINQKCRDVKEVYKWLFLEFMGVLKKTECKIEDISQFWIDNLTALILKIKNEEINAKQAKEIIKYLIEENKDINEIIKELKFVQINDPKIIEEILERHLKTNQKMIDQFNDRPERVEKFFIGMIMKDTNGQANPNICSKIFQEKIKKLIK